MCGEEVDILEFVLLIVVFLNFICLDVLVLLIWGIEVLIFIVFFILGDFFGLWLVIVDVLLLGGLLFVVGFNIFFCGFKDVWGWGGKLNVYDWEFGGMVMLLGGFMICDGGVFVGEWIMCVVEYCGFLWRYGGVRLDGVMFRVCLGGWEIGVLNCGFFFLVLVELLLVLCDFLIVKVILVLGDELFEMDLFVLFVFIGFLFDMLIGFLVWWLILKCLNGLFSSLGGMLGFFLCCFGFLR